MPGQRWTSEERTALRRQLTARGSDLNDVRIKGRSPHAIRSQAARMGLVDQREPRFNWPRAQRQLLRQLKKEGFTPRQIHDFDLLGNPSRSRWAITKQWGRMKLANQHRSRKMRRKKVWLPGEKRKFDRFLRDHSQEMTPEEIGKRWQVARSTVARRQNQLGIKASREAVMQMPYSQDKQSRARRRLRQQNLRKWALRRIDREAQLLALAAELRAAERPPSEQTCSDCGRRWPKRREFFHTRDKKISIGTSRYYKHRCILCENTRRREAERRKRRRGRSSRNGQQGTTVS